MNRVKTQFWICLLLGLGTAILYWPIIGHGFICFDDNDYLVQNWHVQSGLTWSGIAWAFRTGYDANWHPLTWISHMLDCQFFGLNPSGHHLTSLLIHSVNSVLLFVLLTRMTGATWRSAFVAALFAWHPLHVESVAWAAERKDVLCAFFWILTMIAYTQYAREKAGVESSRKRDRSQLFYGITLLLFAFALMSKPMAVTLPFVLLLMDFWPLARISGKRLAASGVSDSATEQGTKTLGALVLEKVPFFLLAVIASVITFKVQQAKGAVISLADTTFSLRIENAFLAYAGYVWKTIWPTRLAVLYPLSRHLAMGLVIAAAFAFMSMSAFAFWFAKRLPYVFSGWFWFVGTLVPVIGIVQVGAQSMADRYAYIPSIGLGIVIAWGAADVLARIPKARTALAGCALVVLVASLVLTRHQLAYWQNGEVLFQHTIAVTRNNFLIYGALGTTFDSDGKTNEALKFCSEAVAMEPDYPDGQYDLGTVLLHAGRTEEAISHFQAALKYYPRFGDAENNLGKAFQSLGKLDEAAAHLAAAARLNPGDPEIHYNLGTVRLMQSKMPDAEREFSEALRLMPAYADAQGNLAVTLIREGKPAEALAHFSEKVRLQPDNPDAHLNFGLALLDQNRPADAAAQFSEALRLQPESAMADYRLALALARQQKLLEAISRCREALRLQPDFPDAREALKSWTGGTN